MGGGGSAPAPPTLRAPKPVPLGKTFGQFLEQRGFIPSLSGFADELNQQFRQTLETGLPGTLGAVSQISTLVNQLLGGNVPADVQAATQRALAQRAQGVGMPLTSEAQIFGEARTFGETSMGLMQQGAAYAPGLFELSNFLSPQQVQNYLFSTGQLRGEQLKQASDEAAVANQNAINKYNYDVAQAQSRGGMFGSIGGLIGGIGGAALGSVVPGIGTAIGGSLGSALGGSIGSFASGGAFAPPAGAGGFGGLISSIGSGIANLGGGATSTGVSATAFSPIGQAFTMPSQAFGAPQYSGNMIYDYLTNAYKGGLGGQGVGSVKGL